MQAIQVWDEPNQDSWLSPAYQGSTPVSPAHYRPMLNASYPAVKAVNPQMLVVTGGTSPYGIFLVAPMRTRITTASGPCQFWQSCSAYTGEEKVGEEGEEEGEESARQDTGLCRPVVQTS